MQPFPDFDSYKRIRFSVTATQHLLLAASVNGVRGKFILDTGASSSCIGFEDVAHFGLVAADSDVKATGAGASNLTTQLAQNNILKIGRWKTDAVHLVVFDLSHVNQALTEHGAGPVNGIIGADVLLKSRAVIDYGTRTLYLK
jgi:predicted aspartyl protease